MGYTIFAVILDLYRYVFVSRQLIRASLKRWHRKTVFFSKIILHAFPCGSHGFLFLAIDSKNVIVEIKMICMVWFQYPNIISFTIFLGFRQAFKTYSDSEGKILWYIIWSQWLNEKIHDLSYISILLLDEKQDESQLK